MCLFFKLDKKAYLQNPLFVLPGPGHSASCPLLNWELLPPTCVSWLLGHRNAA